MFPAYSDCTLRIYEDQAGRIHFTDGVYTWWVPAHESHYGQAFHDIQDWLSGYEPMGISGQPLNERELIPVSSWTPKKGFMLYADDNAEPYASDLALHYIGYTRPAHNYLYA